MNTAETIAAQISSAGALRAMLGAQLFDHGEGLGIRFKAKAKNGANHCQITLDPSDTYTVAWWKIRGVKSTKIAEGEGFHAEDLRRHFESATGLRVSL